MVKVDEGVFLFWCYFGYATAWGGKLPDFAEYDSPFSDYRRQRRKESRYLLTSQNAEKQMVIASSATSKDDERSSSK